MNRNDNHWRLETYRQRMSKKQWREILLAGEDTMIFHGRLRQLKAKDLGVGVVEIYKESLYDEEAIRGGV